VKDCLSFYSYTREGEISRSALAEGEKIQTWSALRSKGAIQAQDWQITCDQKILNVLLGIDVLFASMYAAAWFSLE